MPNKSISENRLLLSVESSFYFDRYIMSQSVYKRKLIVKSNKGR